MIRPSILKDSRKHIQQQLKNSLNAKQVLYFGQYGFRRNMYTSMEIMDLVEEIRNVVDKGKFTIGGFIDLF